MTLFGCDYLETDGILFATHHCTFSKQELDSNTAHNICMTDRYIDCSDYKNASRCFITTAVCLDMGKSDNCLELSLMREFRDHWLIHQEWGRCLIDQYYAVAPDIVKAIDADPNRMEVYRDLYNHYIRPCVKCIVRHDFVECEAIYADMVESLEEKYHI